MADDDVRELERRWRQTRSPDDAARLQQAARRAGTTLALVVDLHLHLVAEPSTDPSRLHQRLRAAADGWTHVVVDLSRGAPILYSFAAAALVHLAGELSARGGALALCIADGRTVHVLDMLGLTAFFDRHASVDEALRARRWTAAGAVTLDYRVFD